MSAIICACSAHDRYLLPVFRCLRSSSSIRNSVLGCYKGSRDYTSLCLSRSWLKSLLPVHHAFHFCCKAFNLFFLRSSKYLLLPLRDVEMCDVTSSNEVAGLGSIGVASPRHLLPPPLRPAAPPSHQWRPCRREPGDVRSGVSGPAAVQSTRDGASDSFHSLDVGPSCPFPASSQEPQARLWDELQLLGRTPST